MSSTQVTNGAAITVPMTARAAMRLEVVVVPVADAGRAKRFYEGLGWRLDADVSAGDH